MDIKDFLEKAYSEVNDNIKFSEAKNAALITLNSALIAWGGSIIFNSDIYFLYRVFVSAFVLLLIFPLICSIMSFRATTGSESKLAKKLYAYLNSMNKIDSNPKKYLYYAYIHKHYNNNPKKYLNDVCTTEIDQNKKPYYEQMARQIVDLAGVAYRKFILFNIGIKSELIIFLLGSLTVTVFLIIKCIIKAC